MGSIGPLGYMGSGSYVGGLWRDFTVALLGSMSVVDAQLIIGADGVAISSVTDSGGHTFAQAIAAAQPTLKVGTNGINGQNVMRFGADDILVCTSAFTTESAGSVFAVVRMTATLATGVVLASADEASTSRYLMLLMGAVSSQQRDNDTADVMNGDTAISAGVPYLVVWHSSGTSYTTQVNGIEQVLTETTGTNNGDWFGDTSARDNVTIGGLRRTSDSSLLKGDIALLGICDTPLRAADIARLETYCAARFGITMS
jgi:hypothetical protein